MAQIDYQPIATGAGANVDSQANFQGSGYQTNGFTAGVAQSAQMNKVWRQSSMIAAAVANVISQVLGGINVLDDGNLTNLVNLLLQMLFNGGNQGYVVPFNSGAPIFDGSKGNIQLLVLTGNVTSSTFINVNPLKKYVFMIVEDGVGGRTFANPTNLPLAPIDTTASATNTQEFVTDNTSPNPGLHPVTPMTVS